ncbi:MAG: hypothetical protein PHW74_01720 [Desulfobacca sp.]|nr:hypothetical protein [Desulfobacca sp.]
MAAHSSNSRYRVIIILVGFALLMALGCTLYRVCTPWNLSHDQIYLGTFDAKAADPSLFNRDSAFHDESFFSHYLPIFRQLLTFLSQLSGSFEAGLWLLVPILVFIYALGWGILLWRWHHSWWIVLLFTFLAIPYRPAPLGEVWGVAGVEGMVARTLVTAPAPYLFLIFFSWLKEPRYWPAILLGSLTGLGAFIYPLTPLSYVELFAGLFLICHWRNKSTWSMLALMLMIFGVLAVYPGTLREQQAWAPGLGISFDDFRHVVQIMFKIPDPWHSFQGNKLIRHLSLLIVVLAIFGGRYLFAAPDKKSRAALQLWLWGGLTVVYLCWRIVGKGAGLSWLYATLAVYVIFCFYRQQLQRQDWWLLGWGFVTLVIYLVPSYLITVIWLNVEYVPLTTWVVEYRRVARLIHPFSYLMGAQAAVYLLPCISQLLRSSLTAVQVEYTLITLAMFNRTIFWVTALAVSLFEAGRRWSRRYGPGLAGILWLTVLAGGYFAGYISVPGSKELFAPISTFTTFSSDYLKNEEELANWAREHTPKDALFYHQSAFFRYRARRSITHGHPTWGETGNYRTTDIVNLYYRSLKLQEAYKHPESLVQHAARLKADYIVIDKQEGVNLNLPLVFENQRFLVYQLQQR